MAYSPSQLYALENVRQVVKTESDVHTVLQEVADCLRHEVPHYEWVGVYVKEGPELVLSAFSGDEETPHLRIPLKQGVHGQAMSKGRLVHVRDVDGADDDSARLDTTRSHVVAPVMGGGGAAAEIIVESSEPHAFDDTDEEFLEAMAESLADALDR